MNSASEKILNEIRAEKDVFIQAKKLLFLNEKENIRIVDLAKALGKQSAYICHLLRLNRLPDIIIDGYYSKMISLSHLFILSRIKDKEKLMTAYEKILGENFTIVQTEELVREILHQVNSQGKYLDEQEKNVFVNSMANISSDLKVKVIQTRIKSKIFFEIKGNLEKTTKVLRKLIEKLKQ